GRSVVSTACSRWLMAFFQFFACRAERPSEKWSRAGSATAGGAAVFFFGAAGGGGVGVLGLAFAMEIFGLRNIYQGYLARIIASVSASSARSGSAWPR